MTFAIVDRSGVLTGELREFVERRLLFALSRFDTRILQTTVVVADAHGPRGGIDKSCRITVKLRRSGDVTITDQDVEIGSCIARAADRVGRAVARAIERTRRIDRSGPPASDSVVSP